MPEGVEKVDTLRQNQDFDEVTVCINSTFHRHKNALKRAVFLVGSEFRLRILVGTRFVSQALPRSCKNDVIYTLSTKPHGFVLFLLVWILFFMDMLFCDTMPHGFGWDTYFHLTAYLL